MSLEKLIKELSGGKARLVSGTDADSLLKNLKAAIDEENAKDCPDPANCPVHGEADRSSTLDGMDLENLTPDNVLQLAISAACGAQWKFERGKYREGTALQEQSALWLTIKEHLDAGKDETIEALRGELKVAYDAMQVAEDRNQFLQKEADRLQSIVDSHGTGTAKSPE